METVPIEALGERLAELARRAEQGEIVVVTRDGKPVLQLVPPQPRDGMDWATRCRRLEEFKRARGIERIVTYISPDFDDPLPENFLIEPLPEAHEKPE